jgi:hypothetical protein
MNALRSLLMSPNPLVFLVDVDNTLLDNDRIQNDLKRHLEREFGAACRDRYWAILEQLFRSWAIEIISAHFNVTGPNIRRTSTC